MTAIQKRIAVAAFFAVGIIFVTIFAAWDFQPARWSFEQRFWFALALIGIPAYAAMFPFEDDRQ